MLKDETIQSIASMFSDSVSEPVAEPFSDSLEPELDPVLLPDDKTKKKVKRRVDEAQVRRLLDAMQGSTSEQETRGRKDKYTVQNKRTGAAGEFQVLPSNIPAWTQKYYNKRLTLEEFKADPKAQRAVFRGEMGRYLRRALERTDNEDLAVRMGAAQWYGGEDNIDSYDNKKRFRPDEPSYYEYTTSVLNRIKKGQKVDYADLISSRTVNELAKMLGTDMVSDETVAGITGTPASGLKPETIDGIAQMFGQTQPTTNSAPVMASSGKPLVDPATLVHPPVNPDNTPIKTKPGTPKPTEVRILDDDAPIQTPVVPVTPENKSQAKAMTVPVDVSKVKGNKKEYAVRKVLEHIVREKGIDPARIDEVMPKMADAGYLENVREEDPVWNIDVSVADLDAFTGRDTVQEALAVQRPLAEALPGGPTPKEPSLLSDKEKGLAAALGATAGMRQPGMASGLLRDLGEGWAPFLGGIYEYSTPGLLDLASKELLGKSYLPDVTGGLRKAGEFTSVMGDYAAREDAKKNAWLVVPAQFAGEVGSAAPRIILTTTATGGNPIVGFGAESFLKSAGRGDDVGTQLLEGGKGAALGALFSIAGKAGDKVGSVVLKRFLNPATAKALQDPVWRAAYNKAVQSGEKITLNPDLVKADFIAQLAKNGTRLGIVGGTGFGVGKLEGQSNWDAAKQGALWAVTDLAFTYLKSGKNRKLLDLNGKVVRVPDENGKPVDVLLTAEAESLVATKVGKAPTEAVSAVVLPKPPAKTTTGPVTAVVVDPDATGKYGRYKTVVVPDEHLDLFQRLEAARAEKKQIAQANIDKPSLFDVKEYRDAIDKVSALGDELDAKLANEPVYDPAAPSGPIPETQTAIEAQTEAAKDPSQTRRIAVMYAGEQAVEAPFDPKTQWKIVKPNGDVILVEKEGWKQKAAELGLKGTKTDLVKHTKAGKDEVAVQDLLGRVEPVEDTSIGEAVVASEAGKEIDAAVLPPNAPPEIVGDQAASFVEQYPGAEVEVKPTQEVAEQRLNDLDAEAKPDFRQQAMADLVQQGGTVTTDMITRRAAELEAEFGRLADAKNITPPSSESLEPRPDLSIDNVQVGDRIIYDGKPALVSGIKGNRVGISDLDGNHIMGTNRLDLEQAIWQTHHPDVPKPSTFVKEGETYTTFQGKPVKVLKIERDAKGNLKSVTAQIEGYKANKLPKKFLDQQNWLPNDYVSPRGTVPSTRENVEPATAEAPSLKENGDTSDIVVPEGTPDRVRVSTTALVEGNHITAEEADALFTLAANGYEKEVNAFLDKAEKDRQDTNPERPDGTDEKFSPTSAEPVSSGGGSGGGSDIQRRPGAAGDDRSDKLAKSLEIFAKLNERFGGSSDLLKPKSEAATRVEDMRVEEAKNVTPIAVGDTVKTKAGDTATVTFIGSRTDIATVETEDRVEKKYKLDTLTKIASAPVVEAAPEPTKTAVKKRDGISLKAGDTVYNKLGREGEVLSTANGVALIQLYDESGLEIGEPVEMPLTSLSLTKPEVKEAPSELEEMGIGMTPFSRLLSARPHADDVSNDLTTFRESYPEVVANLDAAHGLHKDTLLAKWRENAKWLYHSFKRTFINIDPNASHEMAVSNDLLRQLLAAPAAAKGITLANLARITKNLGPKRLEIFTTNLILNDLVKDVEEGLYDGKELPFGIIDATELGQMLEDSEALVANNPAVQDAVDARNAWANDLAQRLVAFDLLPASVLDDPRYFHRQVLEYANDRTFTGTVMAGDVRLREKGFQRARSGSDKDFNTNYAESEFEWAAQAEALILRREILNRLDQVNNIKPQLQAAAELQSADTGEAVSWRDLVPDTHAIWQPKQGNFFYPAFTLTERMLDRLVTGEATLEEIQGEYFAEYETEEGGPASSQISARAVLGARRPEWVIPKELAIELDNFDPKEIINPMENVFTSAQNAWKQWILLSPAKAPVYMLNNLSGDLDITIAYDPKILAQAPAAIRDLKRYHYNQETTPDIEEALKLGVLDSGITVTEIPDINDTRAMRVLTEQDSSGSMAKVWGGIKNLNNFRENMLRLAAYRYFKAKLEAGEEVFAASTKEQIDAVHAELGSAPAAAKLARELLGDYGAVSQAGRWIRRHTHPFWSWVEINSPRYFRMLRNTKFEDGGAGRAGRAAATTAVRTGFGAGKLFLKASLLAALISIYNRTRFPEEDKELRRQGDRNYLIIGRREDGSIRSLKLAGASKDMLEWVGLEDAPKDIDEYRAGDRTLTDQAAEVPKAFVNKLFQGLSPVYKTPMELFTGRQTYPTIFPPKTDTGVVARPIRDRKAHIARVFGLKGVYDAAYQAYAKATGKPPMPIRPWKTDPVGTVLDYTIAYRMDPNETMFFGAREDATNWARERGAALGASEPTERGDALFNYKLSIRVGDQEAAAKWRDEYFRLGGNEDGIKKSIEKTHPLASISKAKDRLEYIKGLSPDRKAQLKQAIAYYNNIFLFGERDPTDTDKAYAQMILETTAQAKADEVEEKKAAEKEKRIADAVTKKAEGDYGPFSRLPTAEKRAIRIDEATTPEQEEFAKKPVTYQLEVFRGSGLMDKAGQAPFLRAARVRLTSKKKKSDDEIKLLNELNTAIAAYEGERRQSPVYKELVETDARITQAIRPAARQRKGRASRNRSSRRSR